MYTETEIQYLLSEHGSGGTRGEARGGGPMIDITESRSRMPQDVLQRVLDIRAERLGQRFTEFRNAHRTITPTTNLESEIAASRLF